MQKRLSNHNTFARNAINDYPNEPRHLKVQSQIVRREIIGNPLFEVTFSKNSAETNRLFALDFYDVIVEASPHRSPELTM